jgi:hypothetical protein
MNEKKYWEQVQEQIKAGGYSMSGLSWEQIRKIMELMRHDKNHGSVSKEMKIIASMLRQVSPRTAIVLYTLAWSKSSNLAQSPTKRQECIEEWMRKTFEEPHMSYILFKAVSPNQQIPCITGMPTIPLEIALSNPIQ